MCLLHENNLLHEQLQRCQTLKRMQQLPAERLSQSVYRQPTGDTPGIS
jgi:hypothetical protein